MLISIFRLQLLLEETLSRFILTGADMRTPNKVYLLWPLEIENL